MSRMQGYLQWDRSLLAPPLQSDKPLVCVASSNIIHASVPRYQLGLRNQKYDARGRLHVVRAADSGNAKGGKETFLSLEEAGLIELSNLESHERFLCRLTVSSLNLLRIISKQEGVPIEELNAGIICDWFQKDKVKREIDYESATLQW
ncbi:hypothetical protein KP509_02G057700 [Ceratopteris richardii]|uniref:Uncharacterized protein n=1 Tax=Ceratopteris richardii TaxID=49495 RepID=A0A8T2V9S7_CERRI|nr:hypothetical protein KP509_02G057700 [Ceratopteris richardii]